MALAATNKHFAFANRASGLAAAGFVRRLDADTHASAFRLIDLERVGLPNQIAQLSEIHMSWGRNLTRDWKVVGRPSRGQTQPSSLSICEITLFKTGIAALGGSSGLAAEAASGSSAAAPGRRFSV